MMLRKLFFTLFIGCAFVAITRGQDSADSALHYYNEYQLAVSAGDFVRCEVLLLQILDQKHTLSEFNQALVYNALGYVYYEMGRFKEALVQYRTAEGLLSGTDLYTLQLKISIHNHQALYHSGLGDYTNALEYYNEALRLLDIIPSWDDLSFNKLSALLLNKGIALYFLERYPEALQILKRSEQLKTSRDHPYLGSVYFNLARVSQSLEEPELSNEYYLKGIDRWTLDYDSGHYELANLYLHYGQFLTTQGRYQQGLKYLHKALKNYQGNYGPNHALTAACHENIADFYMELSDFEMAQEHIQLALQSITGDLGAKDQFSNPDIETSGHNLTLLKILATKSKILERSSGIISLAGEKTKFLDAALASNVLSIEVLHRILSNFTSKESRIYLNSQQKDLFSTGIRLNLEMYKVTKREVYKEEAFLMAAKGKSSELMFEMNSKEWLYLESLSDSEAITAVELRQQIDHFSNLIQTATMGMNPDSAQLISWQDQLFQTRDSFNRHMEQLRRDFPQIGRFESTNIDYSMAKIRRNLNRNETLVEYFLTGTESTDEEQLYIFVVTKKRCHFYESHVDRDVHNNLETIKRNLHGFDPYLETREQFDSLQLSLFSIYQDFIQPVETLLDDNDLVIVPDEELSYIPFDALISQLEPEMMANYAGLPYLLHEYNISYMYNSQMIDRKRPRGWRLPIVTAWIPEYNFSSGDGSGKLNGAVDEVGEILKVTRGQSIRKSQDKAEVANLLQENSILHLAMHSLATESAGDSPYFILDTIQDPLLANKMFDYEVNALLLTTPMVVLSSCETAGGKLHKGEGVMSLSRSFMQAGAGSVVHTLWPVEDTKSREIMVGFYGELKRGNSKSGALTSIKKQYLESQPPSYTHPYYWAAFQVTGDTSPLKHKSKWFWITGSVMLVLLLTNYFKRRSFRRSV